jgi:membrane-associated protease RseP (regulator of RpoE activity)
MTKETKRVAVQVVLFVVTFFSTTVAGNEWATGRNIFFTPDYGWNDFVNGLSFSVPLILILTVHEFGHYFMALYHKVKVSLPYYIPIPPIPYLPFSIGTMGAVIRLRSKPYSNLQNFDIGLAGPLAGFIVALIIMAYGFQTLPPPDYVFKFHPEYEQYGKDYASTVYTEDFKKNQEGVIDVQIGSNLAFVIMGKLFADPERIPNPHEMMHYPLMLACYIALFVTCLNLLPIGQLDGGHVTYGLFGFQSHKMIATFFFLALMFYAGLGLSFLHLEIPDDISLPWLTEYVAWIVGYVVFLFFAFKGLHLPTRDTWMYALIMMAAQVLVMYAIPGVQGYQGWLFFAFLLGRFIGVQHPRSEVELPLNGNRILLGWITLLIFILCFSPAPIVIQ